MTIMPAFHRILCKSFELFIHNPANKQTNKQTDADENNNLSLAEAITSCLFVKNSKTKYLSIRL